MWNFLVPVVASLAGAFIGSNANSAAAESAKAQNLQGAQIASAATLQGAQITADATMAGAKYAGDATMQAAQIQAAALVKAEAAIREGAEKSNETLNSVKQDTAGATGYLRGVIADPGTLTPAQQAQLEQNTREFESSIRGSQFAGSGRTAAALFKKGVSDFSNDALAQNRARADNAAGVLAGQGNQATMAIASNESNLGSNIAGIAARTGQVQGDALAKAGAMTGDATANIGKITGGAIADTGKLTNDAMKSSASLDANAGIANATLMGKAIGDIGSQIATSQREGRYADALNSINSRLRSI